MSLPTSATGLVLVCDKGTQTVPLTASGKASVRICGFAAAVVGDTVPGENITPFGTCIILNSVCSPAPVGAWANPFASCIMGRETSDTRGSPEPSRPPRRLHPCP